MQRTILASIIAKFCPTQFRGPKEKGIKAIGFLQAFATPSEKRSGLNSSASSPHMVLSWWIASTGTHTNNPFEISRSPTFILEKASLARSVAGV
ncbi:hypothetical protein GOP47_0002069 [Adiantum capillus-veneris]|uniref:Uncharacterized protein n=1 Tax=Adiantum capillus-veneris TaxID=13818 RepID=A0A9D4VAU2_ADICA|nr:hypothetical protein GOP47_0002069 [Adiantum capillus-veneris]